MTLSNKRFLILITALTLILALALSWLLFIYWPQSSRIVSERPSRLSSSYQAEQTPSSLGLNIELPYSTLAQAAENGIDKSRTVKLSGKVAGARYQGSIVISRSQPVQITSVSQQALRLSTRMSFKGELGFNGGLARITGTDSMPVDGDVTLSAQLQLDINNDWTPTAKVHFETPHWNSPPSIKALGTSITFQKKANEAILRAAEKVPQKIQAAVEKFNLKDKVARAWKVYQFPLASNALQDQAVATLIPKDVYFSGIHYQPERLQFAVKLGMFASVNIGKTLPFAAAALPNIKTLKRTPKFMLTVPVISEYFTLQSMLIKALGDSPIDIDTPNGVARVAVRQVNLFPTKQGLAIGVNFKADVPHRLFDISGEIFLIAKPELDRKRQRIRLRQVHIYKKLDSDILDTLSTLFGDEIAHTIEAKAEYDLSDKLKESKQKILSRLNKLSNSSNACATLSQAKLELSKLSMVSRYIVIETKLQGDLSLTIANDAKCGAT